MKRSKTPHSPQKRARGKRSEKGGQLSLAPKGEGRGGWRPGAGRKRIPKRKRTRVFHRRRESVSRHVPLHVTLRLVEGFPNLRKPRSLRWVRRCLQLGHKDWFRVVQYSIQGNHLHLLVEADDRRALSRGMQGLKIRLAKRLNQLFDREGGTVFAERYHAEPLTSPKQVRGALSYVLNNRRRHLAQSGRGLPKGYVDAYSSAPHFSGWSTPVRTSSRLKADPVTAQPKTWLLRIGWKKNGPLDPNQVPGPCQPLPTRSP